MPGSSLLNPPDPDPVREYRRKSATSPFLLVGDHAGSEIPASLDGLGLSAADRERHIALDLGVEDLGLALADQLGAVFLRQAYSRLVVDCNRHVEDPDGIREESDGTVVTGNLALSASARDARYRDVFHPYHEAIAREIDRRDADGQETILISLHSFTPVLQGVARPWDIGILHAGHRDDFARSLLHHLAGSGLNVGDNEPYRMDATDYTVPHHAFPRNRRYAELELRQDVLCKAPGQIARAIAEAMGAALRN